MLGGTLENPSSFLQTCRQENNGVVELEPTVTNINQHFGFTV